MKKALENGCCIIRILQEDVYYDRKECQQKLEYAIDIIGYNEIIYLDNNKNYYKKHKEILH